MSQTALPRSTPEAQGVSSAALLAFLDAVAAGAATGRELHSLMLVRHGHVVAEGWWNPYAAAHPHMLFSLSKSFTSTAAGLAITEGKLSLDDTVLSFFPEDAPKSPNDHLKAMQVRHLLMMGSGHDADTLGSMFPRTDGNWAAGFLGQPVTHAPGTHFVYNSGATYMVSAIVQKVTGQRVLDYLRPRLFAPLGIESPTWERCPRGIDTGGWGLSVRTDDIAKFGQLYLQKGVWQGKALLPATWVAEATRKHISNGDPAQPNDWTQGYGYQFWRCRHGAYRGDGAFGQYCVVFPEKDTVLAITSGLGDMQAILDLVWKHLLPGLGDKALPADTATAATLQARLKSLALTAPTGTASAPAGLSGKTFRFPENPQKLESLAVAFDSDGATLTFQEGGKEHRVVVGDGAWRRGETTWRAGNGGLSVTAATQRTAARGGWTDPATYAFRLCFVETPFLDNVTLHFDGAKVTLHYKRNVAFGPTEAAPLEGTAA